MKFERSIKSHITSLPNFGLFGIFLAKIRLMRDMNAPIKKTNLGEISQTRPKLKGMKTAAIWLMVNATPAVDAMSDGSAIF